MRLLISQRIDTVKETGETRDGLDQKWYSTLRKIVPDVEIFPVGNIPADLKDWFSRIEPHGIVLTGGNDLEEDSSRDDTEKSMTKFARELKLPILAVCRGLQLINTIFGGQVALKVHGQVRFGSHVAQNHQVQLPHRSFQGSDDRDWEEVNSYHDHGVPLEFLGRNLVPIALADGQLVEAFVHRTEPILALQWHPERESPNAGFDLAWIAKLFENGVFW